MRKAIYLFLTVLIVACSGDGDSSLRIINDANEDFRITKISMVGYEFSPLNIQFGESQTFNLSDGLSVGSSNININITAFCGDRNWTSSFAIDLIEGSTSTFNFIDCPTSNGYCRSVCLE